MGTRHYLELERSSGAAYLQLAPKGQDWSATQLVVTDVVEYKIRPSLDVVLDFTEGRRIVGIEWVDEGDLPEDAQPVREHHASRNHVGLDASDRVSTVEFRDDAAQLPTSVLESRGV